MEDVAEAIVVVSAGEFVVYEQKSDQPATTNIRSTEIPIGMKHKMITTSIVQEEFCPS